MISFALRVGACCVVWFTVGSVLFGEHARAQPFVHPGGLHTQEDLDRMRDRVAAGDSPWIESWDALTKDRKAQLDYRPAPRANMGASRQRAAADAVAVYLLAIRGYVSGDHRYTDHAIDICNQWSAAVDQKPHGSDQPGLNGIYTYQFAVVGEILRLHVGTRWAEEDFTRFKRMMRDHLYPVCHDFLTRHNGACISHYWANWDACNIAAIAAIGVLCDDRELFDEAVEYFKHGEGNGSIGNAVPFIHPDGLGQWQEAGRDFEHGALGVGLLASFCQIAWNQGLDLYAYDNHRLLAGAEYVARYQLGKPVPFTFYDNCDDVNHYWVSRSQRGRLQRPIWEQLYNHYVVRQGLDAPNVTAIAKLNRPEAFTHDDHFGYGTLIYTLEPSDFPPLPTPDAPQDLTATPGVGRVVLEWTPPEHANGFTVFRAPEPGGDFEQIRQYRGVIPEFTDHGVEAGTTYRYRVAAENQAGTSEVSIEVSATPVAAGPSLPRGWAVRDVGRVAAPGKAAHAAVGESTFVVHSAGASVGGTADGMTFTYCRTRGDTVLTARLIEKNLRGHGRWSRIGITLRSSLHPDAPAAALLLGDLGYRVASFGGRPAPGENMHLTRGNAYSAHLPTWFRITRVGDTFTGYQSDDGETWHEVASTDIDMPAAVYAGIAVSSGSENTVNATFDHVSVVNGRASRER